MLKNVAGQKVTLFAFDATTGLPKTGDAANLTAYVSIDDGAVTALTDTSATERSATNAPGSYLFDVSQAETNGTKLVFSGKSTTANVVVVEKEFTALPNVNVTHVAGVLQNAGVAGTFQSGTTTSGVDSARVESSATHFVGETIVFGAGGNAGLSRTVATFTPGTDTLTWLEPLPTAVTTDPYEIWPGRTSTGYMAPNVVTASAIATDAIDADAIKADAVTKVQAGLATASALTTVDDLLDTEVAAIVSAIAAIAATLAGLNNLSAAQVLTQVNAALDSTVPDSIPADGTRPSMRQSAYMNTQFLYERTVSGTTVTVKKPDGTTLATLTTNHATLPTEITRAT